ncbi:DUF1295 domain-containing protein [Dactylosporangium sp. CA-052675]|uniref:DUF1295 domain-containing protein n=1 Tax=Dactylosporangium sp. CA-052675 TaxID=3239927 RepID=UPI003D91D18F
MTFSALLINLGATVVAVALVMAVTMAYALRRREQSIVDTVWGLGFVVVAVVSFALSAGHGDPVQRWVTLALTAVWGVRLGVYIFARNRGKGEDPRYAALLRRNQGGLVPYVIRTIYWPQGAIMWVVSLPVQAAMYVAEPVPALLWAGVVVWAIGFAFEAVGDAQLARFKRDPANAGRLMDRGLWAWTRHPNYFGDSVVWAGLFLLACSHWAGLPTVIGPALMTHMLVNKSGKALLERRMSRSRGPQFAEYAARTSGFFPRPPRRA